MEFDNKTLEVGCQTPFKIQVIVFKISENGKNLQAKRLVFLRTFKIQLFFIMMRSIT